MSATTLVLYGLLSAVIAAVYATVGFRLIRRPVVGDARNAVFLFATWWIALAGSTFLDAAESFLAAAGIRHLAVFTVLAYTSLFLVSMALLGLVYYLVYLFTGRSGALDYLAAFYVGFFAIALYSLSSADPTGVEVGRWTVNLTYAKPVGGSLLQVLILLLLFPPILGALGYLRLFSRVDDPTQRYRIGLVGTSILLWFGSAYGASLVGLSDAVWWPIASSGIGLLAAMAIWAAYLPPSWVRSSLDVEPLGASEAHGVRPTE